MKTTKYIVAMLAGAAVLASCVKEAGKELPAPQDLITIKAGLPEDVLTKAGAHVGFSWYWGAGDKIAVTGAEDSQIFTIKDGFTPKFAEFVGRPVAGESFSITYPTNAETADWSAQTQDGNNSYAHLKYAAQLSGVDDYLSFCFNEDWAAAHGGTIKQIGVMKMTIALPDTVTAVNGVSIAAEDAIFFKGNGDAKVKKLDLAVTNAVPDAQHQFIAWFTTSWNEVTVPENTVITVSVKTKGTAIEKDVTFTKEAVLMGGKVNTFDVDKTGWVLPSHYAAGKGTAEKPWVINTAEQIAFMKDDMSAGVTRYFKLGADIDMTGIEWTPLNNVSPYDKGIDFDGDGHTISNFTCSATSMPSFFGLLNGSCRNVKFVNASVGKEDNSIGTVGILGGRGGDENNITCTVSNVSVQGKLFGNKYVGGLFGYASQATISACSADVIIDANGQMVGGLIGEDFQKPVTITNCWTAGSISSKSSIVGGLVGDLAVATSSIYNSYSTASVKTQFIYGGIVGRAVAGQKSNKTNCTNQNPKNHIEYCIAWNDKLSSDYVTDTSEHYGSGSIVGQTAFKNYLVGCVRKANIDLSFCVGNTTAGGYDPFDQEDSDPDNPMTIGSGTYAFGYHGKAAGATETLSQVAQRIGWSADIWDFSGDTPKLK